MEEDTDNNMQQNKEKRMEEDSENNMQQNKEKNIKLEDKMRKLM